MGWGAILRLRTSMKSSQDTCSCRITMKRMQDRRRRQSSKHDDNDAIALIIIPTTLSGHYFFLPIFFWSTITSFRNRHLFQKIIIQTPRDHHLEQSSSRRRQTPTPYPSKSKHVGLIPNFLNTKEGMMMVHILIKQTQTPRAYKLQSSSLVKINTFFLFSYTIRSPILLWFTSLEKQAPRSHHQQTNRLPSPKPHASLKLFKRKTPKGHPLMKQTRQAHHKFLTPQQTSFVIIHILEKKNKQISLQK